MYIYIRIHTYIHTHTFFRQNPCTCRPVAVHTQIDAPRVSCRKVGTDSEAARLTFFSSGSTLVPPDSWLQHIDTAVAPDFVPDLVTTLWELIQHARFNGFLMSQFGCGPQVLLYMFPRTTVYADHLVLVYVLVLVCVLVLVYRCPGTSI